MASTTENVHEFFERYASALLDRDEHTIARMYAVPSLILFPGKSIVVSDATQTERFFAASWAQYEGVSEIRKRVAIMGEAPKSVWVDVTWTYEGDRHERFCYQLIEGDNGYQIAVLTPMGHEGAENP